MDPQRRRGRGLSVRFWDFLFYASFGFVVTSSVSIAGVLLVFCYLIVPSVAAMLYADTIGPRLAIGWTMGTIVSALGISVAADRSADRRDHRVHVRPGVDCHGGGASTHPAPCSVVAVARDRRQGAESATSAAPRTTEGEVSAGAAAARLAPLRAAWPTVIALALLVLSARASSRTPARPPDRSNGRLRDRRGRRHHRRHPRLRPAAVITTFNAEPAEPAAIDLFRAR